MKLTHFMTTLAMSVVVFGCASTGTQQATYPTLTVLSDKPFVWDNSKSEAMNVALMAQPAGVGFGVHDSRDGTTVTTGYVHGGTRLIDGALGLATSGIFGAVEMESNNRKINGQLDWKPTIVDFVAVDSVSKENLFKDVQLKIADRVKQALLKEYPSMQWIGSLTPIRPTLNMNTEFVFFNEKACRESILFASKDKEKQKQAWFNKNVIRKSVEQIDIPNQLCRYSGKLSIASTTVINGKQHYVVIFEGAAGHLFAEKLKNHYQGYMVVPDFYSFTALDSKSTIDVNSSYASVFKNGTQLLFQRSN